MKSKMPFSNAEDFSALDNTDINYDVQHNKVTLSKEEKNLIEEQCEKFNVPFKIFKAFAEKENATYKKNGINKYKYHIVFLELNNLLEGYMNLVNKNDEDCMNLFFMPTKDVYAKIEYLKNEDKENFDILSVLDFNYLDADEFDRVKKKYTYTKEELKDMNNKYDFLWNMKKHIKKNKRVRTK